MPDEEPEIDRRPARGRQITAAALGGLLHADATWHHRNDDRLVGLHRGSDAITAYLARSAQLTAGTLRAVPQSFMADGQ